MAVLRQQIQQYVPKSWMQERLNSERDGKNKDQSTTHATVIQSIERRVRSTPYIAYVTFRASHKLHLCFRVSSR